MSFNIELKWAPQPGKQHKILSGLDGKISLDVSQSKHDKNNLIVWESSNGDNQRFLFTCLGGNRYAIFSAKDNSILEIADGNDKNGARLRCAHQDHKVSEYFDLIPANFQGKNNAFYLKTFCGKALDVEGGQSKNEAKVIQYEFSGKNNQIWIIQQA